MTESPDSLFYIRTLQISEECYCHPHEVRFSLSDHSGPFSHFALSHHTPGHPPALDISPKTQHPEPNGIFQMASHHCGLEWSNLEFPCFIDSSLCQFLLLLWVVKFRHVPHTTDSPEFNHYNNSSYQLLSMSCAMRQAPC